MSDNRVVEEVGLTRKFVRWLAKVYYPVVEVEHADRIPQTGPVLLCANHANSLVDPVLVGVAARRPVRFMAKAPLFDNPIIGPPMKALGMIPAYRGSDDAGQVKRNMESLDVGANVLKEGQAMGIFPEGKSTDQAHLEMIRSGAARMALQACEAGTNGIQVIPIGLTYEHKETFRSAVLIQVGEPIDVDACLAEHDGSARKARRALTEKLEARLKEVVVHLDEPQWEPWLDDLETLAEAPKDAGKSPTPPLKQRKRIADAMNHFLASDRERTEAIAEEIADYRKQVELAGLRVDSPVLRLHGLRVFGELLWHFFCLLVLFLPALAGTLHHLFPFVMVRGLASRLDRSGRMTTSTFRMLVGLPVYVIWYGLVAWWMLGYFSAWFAWGWLISAPFCGVIAIHYWRRGGHVAMLLWHQLCVIIRRDKLNHLRQLDTHLRGRLQELAADYAKIVPRPESQPRPSFNRRMWTQAAKRTTCVLLIAAAIWIAKYRFFDRPLGGNGLDLQTIPPQRIEAFLSADEKVLVQLIDGIDQLEKQAEQIHSDFIEERRFFTNQKDDDDLRELLRRYLSYRGALLRMIWKYQSYAEIENDELRLRTFLLDFTAAAVLYEASLKFVHRFGDRSPAVAKLNEPEPNWDIPAGLYDRIRRNLASPRNIEMFELARQYYHQRSVQKAFSTHGLASTAPYDRFHTAIAGAEKTILSVNQSVAERILEVAVTDLGRLIHQVQYQTQSLVSTWIGDFKIRQPHLGKALIGKEQLAKLAAVLQPGDILLERRNWYLSNAFLPGYWPHGAVYVGTAEQLRKRGLDQQSDVVKHWEEFAAKDHEGHEHVIIEAVSEGVVFSSLEHSIGGADSVAVLRPKVDESEKNESIIRAFRYAGRPYDFEFDFETPSKLVCTEVVYRAYGGNSGTIQFPLEAIMGRQTMPAINLVKKFHQEYDSDDAQFEFVAFIDGDELSETSRFLTDVDAFRNTLDRPASSFVQASDPIAWKSIGTLGRVLLCLTIAAAVAGCLMLPRLRMTPLPGG